MARLRRVTPQMKGWTRRRAGRGFAYYDSDGRRLPPEEVERIRSLAIPPAWQHVWICPYANGSFGLTTLERRHVRRRGSELLFEFVGKSGIEHTVTINDPQVVSALDVMRRRRGGSARLLAYRGDSSWADLDAAAVNAYISEMVHEDLTAKDFRTWHATVLAAVALAESPEKGDTKASRKRAVKAAVEEVAAYLGNTPTIARKSYIDPRVI